MISMYIWQSPIPRNQQSPENLHYKLARLKNVQEKYTGNKPKKKWIKSLKIVIINGSLWRLNGNNDVWQWWLIMTNPNDYWQTFTAGKRDLKLVLQRIFSMEKCAHQIWFCRSYHLYHETSWLRAHGIHWFFVHQGSLVNASAKLLCWYYPLLVDNRLLLTLDFQSRGQSIRSPISNPPAWPGPRISTFLEAQFEAGFISRGSGCHHWSQHLASLSTTNYH